MTLQDTLSTQELNSLDMSKVAALQQKRTLAFVNHFVITTVQFMNNFMKNCEQKLINFERKLEKVDAAMVLLEARLSSIPEVNTEQEGKVEEKPPANATPDHTDQNDVAPSQSFETQVEEPTPVPSEPGHPEYNRFIKMVQVGVPVQAVKLKISSEGLDPSILDQLLGGH